MAPATVTTIPPRQTTSATRSPEPSRRPFRDNPRPRVHVLLRLDAGSVGGSGDFPLAWVQSYGEGRVYYNALGHFAETWSDPRFQQQLAAAIRWVARR